MATEKQKKAMNIVAIIFKVISAIGVIFTAHHKEDIEDAQEMK